VHSETQPDRNWLLSELQRNRWLGELPQHILSEFAAIAHVRRLRHGELFAARGSVAPGLGVVLKGAVSASSFSDQGHEFALSMLEFGDVWGLAAVLDGKGMLRDSRAYGETEILLLPRADFLATFERHSMLSRAFIDLLCQRIRTAHVIIDDLALRSLRQRLARLLCALSVVRDDAAQPTVTQTQDALASLLGVSRHAVNRELKLLEAAGWVRLGYGALALTDVGQLETMWRDGDGAVSDGSSCG